MSKNLETLKKRQAQLEAQIRDAEAREKTKQRKQRTSRLIVVGALVEHHTKANPQSETAKLLARLVDEYTYTKTHRALFDLEPLSEAEEKSRRARARKDKVKF